MNKYLTLALASLVVISSASASLINFQSGSLSSYLQADGTTNLDSTYSFALGTFNESVLSGTSNTWGSGFTDQMDGVNTWKTSGPAPLQNKFQNENAMTSATANGQAAYIFGYNVAVDEIILFKNAAWIFPTRDSLDTVADIFSLQDAGTQVVTTSGAFASFNNNLTMLAVVPEPSTYAMLAGVLALGYVMIRRRK